MEAADDERPSGEEATPGAEERMPAAFFEINTMIAHLIDFHVGAIEQRVKACRSSSAGHADATTELLHHLGEIRYFVAAGRDAFREGVEDLGLGADAVSKMESEAEAGAKELISAAEAIGIGGCRDAHVEMDATDGELSPNCDDREPQPQLKELFTVFTATTRTIELHVAAITDGREHKFMSDIEGGMKDEMLSHLKGIVSTRISGHSVLRDGMAQAFGANVVAQIESEADEIAKKLFLSVRDLEPLVLTMYKAMYKASAKRVESLEEVSCKVSRATVERVFKMITATTTAIGMHAYQLRSMAEGADSPPSELLIHINGIADIRMVCCDMFRDALAQDFGADALALMESEADSIGVKLYAATKREAGARTLNELDVILQTAIDPCTEDEGGSDDGFCLMSRALIQPSRRGIPIKEMMSTFDAPEQQKQPHANE